MSRSRYGRWQANCIQVRIEQLEFCFYWFTLDKSVFKRRVYFSFDCVLFLVVLIRFDFPFCKRKQTKKGKVGACFFLFFFSFLMQCHLRALLPMKGAQCPKTVS